MFSEGGGLEKGCIVNEWVNYSCRKAVFLCVPSPSPPKRVR